MVQQAFSPPAALLTCNHLTLTHRSSNHKSYTTRSKCTDYSKKGDQTCCTKMKAAKKDACVTQEVVDNCDKGKASHTAGYIGIVASILGCVGACLALGNCCNNYYDPPKVPEISLQPMQAQPGMIATAQPVADQTVTK